MATPSAQRSSLSVTAAIKQVPALAVPVITAMALLNLLLPRLVQEVDALPGLSHALLHAPAVVLGLILYSLGNVWDEFIFDRWYGLMLAPQFEPAGTPTRRLGLWTNRTRRTFGLFPPGHPLDMERANWNELAPEEMRGYRGAETTVREAGRWAEVEAPLVLSKFARSFIWPALLVAFVFAVLAMPRPDTAISLSHQSGLSYALVAAVALCAAFGALVPYVEFRVEHMRRLYRLAADLAVKAKRAEVDRVSQSSAVYESVRSESPATRPSEAPAARSRDAAAAMTAIVAVVAVVGLLMAYGLSLDRGKQPTTEQTPPPPAPVVCCGCQGGGDNAGIVRELAAIRALIENQANARPPPCPSPPASAPPPAPDQTAASDGATWVNVLGVASVLVALGGMAIALSAGNTKFMRVAGLLTATLGPLLSFGGFTLLKDPKIDIKIDEISLKVLRELRTEVSSLGPRSIGTIAPFAIGEADRVEGPALQREVDAMARVWIDQRKGGKDGVLMIVGATDRLPLRGAKQSQYDANVGLARARAEFVKDALAARVLQLVRDERLPAAFELLPSQVMTLVSGPASTPGAAGQGSVASPAAGHPEDRRVDVWAFWSTKTDKAGPAR